MATDTRQKQESSVPARDQRDRLAPETTERRWDRPSSFNPFAVMRQGLDEMERWIGQFGGSRSGAHDWTPSRFGRGLVSRMSQPFGDWTPAIDAFQRGNEFVVRVEAPGMNREDLSVVMGDEQLTIHGERKREFEEDRDGVYWSERSYGSFTRTVPLPPGVIADSAKATFNNGLLEIVMQAPPAEARRGRRIEIAGSGETNRG
jgi:HSP20 family protein